MSEAVNQRTRTRWRFVAAGCVGTGALAAILGVVTAAAPAGRTQAGPHAEKSGAFPLSAIREEVIGQITAGNEMAAAASGAGHVLWAERRGDYRIVFFDGKQQGGEYANVSSPEVSADGRHCAFVGEISARQFAVVDGQKLPGEHTRIADLQLGPESGFYSYIGCFGGQCRLVVNGKEQGPEYRNIRSPSFTAGHEHYFYLGEQNDRWVLVHDGKEEGPKIEDSAELWISHDGRHTAMAVHSNHKWGWIVDGAPGPAFLVISPLAITEDGEHSAYAGAKPSSGKSSASSVVIDGKISASYDGASWLAGNQGVIGMVERAKLHLPYGFLDQRYGSNPTGNGSGYGVGRGVHSLLAKWDGVSDPLIAGAGKAVYAAKRGGKDFAVFIDGTAGPGFEDISTSIAVSRDKQHIGYVGLQQGSFVEVIDQQTSRSYPRGDSAEYVGQVLLSDDAAHVSYEIIGWGTHQREKRRMVVDGQGGAVYDALAMREFQFSSDGRHHAYVVSSAHGDQDAVVFDGRESPAYESVVAGSLSFNGDRAICFVALKGRRWVRVSESLD